MGTVSRLRSLYQLSLADFRERTRRTGFFVTMLGVLFFSYLVITGKYTVQFGEFRTVYDSTWAGTLMAVCSAIMLVLIGFYLIRGTIARDRRTEVGQIIAATPLRGRKYLLSKFISNIAVLWSMVAALALVAFVTLLFRNESGRIDLWAFALPFLLISLPATVFVAGVAIFFDTVRWLRGSAGVVIYLFLAEMCLVLGMLEVPFLDVGAVSFFTDSVRATAQAIFPGEKIGLVMGFVAFDPALQVTEFRTFQWGGIDWTEQAILFRLTWIGIAGVVVVLAIPFFDRFDPAIIRRKHIRKRKTRAATVSVDVRTERSTERTYEGISVPQFQYRSLKMLTAELRLALKGRHWFWYAVALGLLGAQLVSPYEVARMYLTPALMVWPLVVWSAMGTREPAYNTGSLVFSSPRSISYQFPAIWVSGLLVALAGVGLMVLRAILAGQWPYAAALLVAAVLVPTAALALGTLSGGRRIFEILYLMVWYVGSIDQLTALDILGTTDEAVTGFKLIALSLVAVTSLLTAFAARRLQMSRG